MDIIATAITHIRDNADLLGRNGYDVERLIARIGALIASEPYNAEVVALTTVGSQIMSKGLRMAGVRSTSRNTVYVSVRGDENLDGDRLTSLGANLSSYIAHGCEPLTIR